VNGGRATFDAPLLTPKSAEPARIVAHSALRATRRWREVAREEMSDIATEYFRAFIGKIALDEMCQRVDS